MKQRICFSKSIEDMILNRKYLQIDPNKPSSLFLSIKDNNDLIRVPVHIDEIIIRDHDKYVPLILVYPNIYDIKTMIEQNLFKGEINDGQQV